MSNTQPARRAVRRITVLTTWSFSTTRLRGPVRRIPPATPSIGSAWLRSAGDRPKLAAARPRP